MQPRQMRETFSPVLPRETYSIRFAVRGTLRCRNLGVNHRSRRDRRSGETAATGWVPKGLRFNISAFQAERTLKPYEKTIADAVAFYVRHLEAVKKSITVRELADEYLEFQKSYNRSEVHQRDLRGRFNRFCLIWGPSPSRSHFYRNQEMVVRDERRTQNF